MSGLCPARALLANRDISSPPLQHNRLALVQKSSAIQSRRTYVASRILRRQGTESLHSIQPPRFLPQTQDNTTPLRAISKRYRSTERKRVVCREGRRSKYLVESCPKTCRSASESLSLRSNQASKIGPAGVVSCVVYDCAKQAKKGRYGSLERQCDS